jgi:hypothetical protein
MSFSLANIEANLEDIERLETRLRWIIVTSRFPNPQVGGSIPPQEGVQHDSFCLPQKKLGFACGAES